MAQFNMILFILFLYAIVFIMYSSNDTTTPENDTKEIIFDEQPELPPKPTKPRKIHKPQIKPQIKPQPKPQKPQEPKQESEQEMAMESKMDYEPMVLNETPDNQPSEPLHRQDNQVDLNMVTGMSSDGLGSAGNFTNFNMEEQSKDTIDVFNLNTSWCGWSVKFQPEWDKFTEMVKDKPNINAVDVKCDQKENEEVCQAMNVPGFPSVVIIKNGKDRIDYNGARQASEILKFVETL